jgi:hypothetical protein
MLNIGTNRQSINKIIPEKNELNEHSKILIPSF